MRFREKKSMKNPPWVDKADDSRETGQTPMASQFTLRLPDPDEPAIQTWKLVVDSLPVFRTAIPLEDGFPAYDTMIVGVLVNPAVKLTVVQDTPVTVV